MAGGVGENSASMKYLTGFSRVLNWRSTQFVNALQDVRSCSLCGVVPNSTHLLACCHAFCDFCYDRILNNDRVCPVDGECFNGTDVKLVEFLESRLLKQHVRCWNNDQGCDFAGPLEDALTHFHKHCGFHQVRCARCEGMVIRRDIFTHYKQDCKGEKCVAQPQLFTSARGTRNIDKIEDMLSSLTDTQRSIHGSLNSLTAMIEQGLRGVEASVSGQIRELGLVRVNHDEFSRSCSTTFQEIQRSLDGLAGTIRHQDWLKKTFSSVLQESSDKVYWSVDNISYRVQRALCNKEVRVVSDRFSISNYTARLCFTLMKRSDDLAVAIHLCLCPGPKDDELSWPFVIPFMLTLIHPKDGSKSSRKKVDPLDSRFSDCFLRPVVSDNAGVGGSCFIIGSMLEGFVINDAVLVSVELTR